MSYSVLALVNYLLFGRNDRDIYKGRPGLSFAVGTSLTFLPPSARLILIFLAAGRWDVDSSVSFAW